MLIAATAFLATVLPVLRRSAQTARPSKQRPAPAQRRGGPAHVAEDGAQRWGSIGGFVFARWERDRHDCGPQGAPELQDEYEVEQMVREQLYGRRGPQR